MYISKERPPLCMIPVVKIKQLSLPASFLDFIKNLLNYGWSIAYKSYLVKPQKALHLSKKEEAYRIILRQTSLFFTSLHLC